MPRAKTKPQPRSRGSIVPEGDGKYRIRVFIGKDANGKRQYVSKLVVGTISQAQRERTRLLREIDTQTLARPTGETLAAFIERYITDVKQHEVLAATLRGYRIQVNTHIIPELGNLKLTDITPFRLQQWITGLVGEGLSYASVRHAYVILRMALQQAVEWNVLVQNPADRVSLPAKLKAERPEMQTFTAEQMHRFLAGLDTLPYQYSRYAAIFHVLLYSGLRPSEAAVLKWSDVDMDTSTLTVRRALTQISSGHWEVRAGAKTKQGMRTLAVPSSVIQRLQSHRTTQLRDRMAAGPAWKDNDYVFTTREGEFIAPHNLSRAWKRCCTLTDVPCIRLYDARHTATTLELDAGVDIKTISKRRGHASVAFTLDRYGHVMDSMDRNAADALEQSVQQAGKVMHG